MSRGSSQMVKAGWPQRLGSLVRLLGGGIALVAGSASCDFTDPSEAHPPPPLSVTVDSFRITLDAWETDSSDYQLQVQARNLTLVRREISFPGGCLVWPRLYQSNWTELRWDARANPGCPADWAFDSVDPGKTYEYIGWGGRIGWWTLGDSLPSGSYDLAVKLILGTDSAIIRSPLTVELDRR